MSDRTFNSGALVRRSSDQGPKSFGVVLNVRLFARVDGVQLVPLQWYDDRREAEYMASFESMPGAYREASYPPPEWQPTTMLVPLCDQFEVYPDEYGIACSEPGVPTSIEVRCNFDATRTIHFRADDGKEEWTANYCTEHADELHAYYREHPTASGSITTDEPVRLPIESITSKTA